MSGNLSHASPSLPPGNKTPTRDNRGRWVRRAGNAGDTPAQDFVFDDRVFEGAPPAAEEPLPRADGVDSSAGDFSGASAASSGARAVAKRTASRPLLLFGALLLGLVFFVLQRGYFTARAPDPATPTAPPSIVAPVVIPAAPRPRPGQAARRPAPPRPLDSDREATGAAAAPAADSAPRQAVPPTPTPTPTPIAVVAAPAPAQPEQTPLFDSEPAPAVATPSIQDEEGWFTLAEEYLQLGEDKRAEALYRRILDEGSQRGRAALALGDLFARRKDFARAQKFYRTSKQLFQDGDRSVPPP